MCCSGVLGVDAGLLYAQAYPDHVSALILRGIFLCRQMDLDWLYRFGANQVFPDHWEEFVKPFLRRSAAICWMPIIVV